MQANRVANVNIRRRISTIRISRLAFYKAIVLYSLIMVEVCFYNKCFRSVSLLILVIPGLKDRQMRISLVGFSEGMTR